MVTKTDLKSLTSKQLNELQQDVVAALRERRQLAISQLREQFEDLAAAEGLTMEEVVGSQRGKWQRGPKTIKYRDPDHPRNTWSGRGRTPRWLSDKLRGGKSLQDYGVS